jgi:hypothetical protein
LLSLPASLEKSKSKGSLISAKSKVYESTWPLQSSLTFGGEASDYEDHGFKPRGFSGHRVVRSDSSEVQEPATVLKDRATKAYHRQKGISRVPACYWRTGARL